MSQSFYAVVSATCVVKLPLEREDGKYLHAPANINLSRTIFKVNQLGFTDRKRVVEEVDRLLTRKRASLARQLAELATLTGESVVAAADAKESPNA